MYFSIFNLELKNSLLAHTYVKLESKPFSLNSSINHQHRHLQRL